MPHWHKTRKFVLAEKGRWGLRWLHRLMLRMCTNPGMIQHERGCLFEKHVNSYVLAPMEAFAYASEAIHLWHEHMGDLENCEVIMGQSFHTELMASEALRREIRFDVRFAGRYELLGVPFRVVPLFEGCAVIPLRRTR